MIQRLHETIAAVCPISGVSVNPTAISFAPEATQQQRDAANAALAAFDWSQQAHDTWVFTKFRARAQAALDQQQQEINGLIRALALVVLDENNILRTWLRDFKTEVAASASLADLKTRVATLPTTSDRTAIQLRNAIKAQISGGKVDS